MGRTYRKGGREADHKRRREQWKRQKGQKHIKESDDERDTVRRTGGGKQRDDTDLSYGSYWIEP